MGKFHASVQNRTPFSYLKHAGTLLSSKIRKNLPQHMKVTVATNQQTPASAAQGRKHGAGQLVFTAQRCHITSTSREPDGKPPTCSSQYCFSFLTVHQRVKEFSLFALSVQHGDICADVDFFIKMHFILRPDKNQHTCLWPVMASRLSSTSRVQRSSTARQEMLAFQNLSLLINSSRHTAVRLRSPF